jgi:hypothetical protein
LEKLEDGQADAGVALPTLSERRARARTASLAARLTSGRPATQVLRAWCDAQGLEAGPIRARKRRSVTLPGRDARAVRHLGEGERALRRVALVRGRLPLCFAELRWRPDRLPAQVRRVLATTERPFGDVVAPLGPERITLAVERPAARCAILLVEAVVLIDETPIAVVHERYLATLIAF